MIREADEIEAVVLEDDGTFPNSDLPALIYRRNTSNESEDMAAEFEDVFASNNWTGSWRNGVYSYHHYHSTTHEVLGVCRGSARLRLGGDDGQTVAVQRGDVVIIPAGVAHKNVASSSDFEVVGAYPNGRSFDMNYGKDGERPAVDENIADVPLPAADPVYGEDGPLRRHWS